MVLAAGVRREMVKARVVALGDSWCRGASFDALVEEHTSGAFDAQLVAELVVAAGLREAGA